MYELERLAQDVFFEVANQFVALYLNRTLRSEVIHDLNAVNVVLKSWIPWVGGVSTI